MTASAVFVLDVKGKVIISRNYRGDVPLNAIERFSHLMLDEVEGSSPPIIVDKGVSFAYVKYNNLYLVACTTRNSNATTLFLFLYHIINVFKEYFRELEEESIRDNFVVIYELLDEMMDWGYPQITDQKILSEYIMQESHKIQGVAKPPPAVTGVVSWRSEGIKYRKNEIFLDVVESVNLLVGSNGNVLRSEILGALKMRSYLRCSQLLMRRSCRLTCPASGMPELKLGLNDKLLFESTGRNPGKGKVSV